MFTHQATPRTSSPPTWSAERASQTAPAAAHNGQPMNSAAGNVRSGPDFSRIPVHSGARAMPPQRMADHRTIGGSGGATAGGQLDARSAGGETFDDTGLVDASTTPGSSASGATGAGGPPSGPPAPPAGPPSPPPGPPTPPPPPPPAVAVTFGGPVRSASTPAAMVDRIAPGRSVPVPVTVANWSPPMIPITVRVTGGAGAGTATVNGAASAQITASGPVTIGGGTQTGVGKGAGLRVTAAQGGTTLASSSAFAVCAVPTDWTDTLVGPVTGAKRGIKVQDGWSSDGSGTIAELDATEISEQVQYVGGTGCFAGITSGSNSGYLPGNSLTQDTHSTPVSLLTSAGHISADQVSTFNEKRTGATNIAMANSGMRVSRDVRAKAGGGLEIETGKQGAAVTARGFSSAAGSASISLTQDV